MLQFNRKVWVDLILKLILLIITITTLQKSILTIIDEKYISTSWICVSSFVLPFQTGKSFMIPKLSTLNIGTNS